MCCPAVIGKRSQARTPPDMTRLTSHHAVLSRLAECWPWARLPSLLVKGTFLW